MFKYADVRICKCADDLKINFIYPFLNIQIQQVTRDELIKQLSATIGKTKVDKLTLLLKQQDFALRDLIDLTFHNEKTIAYRAAWLLENVLLANPVIYLPELDYLLSRFKEVKYESCQRHYAKIFMHLTSPKMHTLIKTQLAQTDMQPVIEQCFDWIIDPKVLIAVKRFAVEALFNLRGRYGWISDELVSQIQFLMRDGSPAIQTYGRKLLAALQK